MLKEPFQGHQKEPWFPRPLIQDLEMHMPLLNMDNQQGKLEEKYELNAIPHHKLIYHQHGPRGDPSFSTT